MRGRWRVLLAVLVAVALSGLVGGLVGGCRREEAIERSYNTACYREQGGDKWVCGSGGEFELQSGATLDIQSGATTDFSSGIDLDGASLVLDANGNTSITADTDDQIDVEISGADDFQFTANTFTVLSGSTLDCNGPLDVDTSGSIDLTSTEAAADAIFLDANGTVTSGVDIDVGSVSGLTIDGGLTNIGGTTADVASGDNDVVIAGVLEVDGEFELDGALDADSTASFADSATFAGNVTMAAALYTSFTDLTVEDGDTITPTYTTYALDCGEEVTITLAATGTEGQLLVLIGDDTGPININDTNVRTNDGNAQTLGAYDAIMRVFQDTEWIEISESDNE